MTDSDVTASLEQYDTLPRYPMKRTSEDHTLLEIALQVSQGADLDEVALPGLSDPRRFVAGRFAKWAIGLRNKNVSQSDRLISAYPSEEVFLRALARQYPHNIPAPPTEVPVNPPLNRWQAGIDEAKSHPPFSTPTRQPLLSPTLVNPTPVLAEALMLLLGQVIQKEDVPEREAIIACIAKLDLLTG